MSRTLKKHIQTFHDPEGHRVYVCKAPSTKIPDTGEICQYWTYRLDDLRQHYHRHHPKALSTLCGEALHFTRTKLELRQTLRQRQDNGRSIVGLSYDEMCAKLNSEGGDFEGEPSASTSSAATCPTTPEAPGENDQQVCKNNNVIDGAADTFADQEVMGDSSEDEQSVIVCSPSHPSAVSTEIQYPEDGHSFDDIGAPPDSNGSHAQPILAPPLKKQKTEPAHSRLLVSEADTPKDDKDLLARTYHLYSALLGGSTKEKMAEPIIEDLLPPAQKHTQDAKFPEAELKEEPAPTPIPDPPTKDDHAMTLKKEDAAPMHSPPLKDDLSTKIMKEAAVSMPVISPPTSDELSLRVVREAEAYILGYHKGYQAALEDHGLSLGETEKLSLLAKL